MKFLDVITCLVLLVTLSNAQSPYNSISHGIILDEMDASSLAQGSIGLIPSHNSRFSTLNPATWSDLRFTYLTIHYNGGEIQYPDRDFKTEFGRLTNVAFIVPIKEKYAWGFGLRPYSRKQFSIEDDKIAPVIFSGDTLTVTKKVDGTGGISSFYSAGSWKINKDYALGLQWEFLFGVFDEEDTTFIDNRHTYYRRHFEFKATLLSLFLRSSQLESSRHSTIYVGLKFPIGRQKIIETDSPMFAERDRKPSQRLSLPLSLYGGLVYHMSRHTHFGFEILNRWFSESKPSVLNTLAGREENASRISLGLLRERIPGSQRFFNRLHYRIGFFRREHYISRSKKDLKELGIALGFGFPFGNTQNQIDIGLRVSKREGFLTNESELIRLITIGVTIGDIWLVKRRRR